MVKVKPNSKKQSVECIANNTYVVCTSAPPVDGKANESVLKLLSSEMNLPVSRFRILKGHTSKTKLIEILDRI